MQVSVIIPCYNYGKYLAEAIESVLNQTVKCEIVVVNDGSTDETDKVAKSFGKKITYISQENKGLPATRNTGIKASTGSVIVCLDADDTLEPTFVEKCLERLSEGVGAVRTGIKEFGESNLEYIYDDEVTYGEIRKRNMLVTTSMFPKKVWEEVGGYDEAMVTGYEDWEFWIRVVKAGYTVETVREPLFNYRKHGHSMITDTDKKYEEIYWYIESKHHCKGKVLFLEDVHKNISGVTYYRMLIPARTLSDMGYEVKFSAEVLAVDEDGKNPKIIADDLEWADIVVFPRYFQFSPNVIVSIMNFVKSMGKRVIYETDDYLYKLPDHNPVAKFVNLESAQKLIHFLEDNADAKTVTTRKLQELIGGTICPNSIDLRDWEGIENAETGKTVIGWAGGWTHKKDLEMLIPVLKRLKEKHKFEIRLLGYDPEIAKTDLYYKVYPWASVLEYPTKLAELGFDIGIAPIVDDEFNQYKSNIKWLEYAMLGVPVVASNLPPYEDIEDGVTGYLATTEDEWYDKLDKLLSDAKLRQTIGEQAKAHVIENYNIKQTISQWESAYGK